MTDTATLKRRLQECVAALKKTPNTHDGIAEARQMAADFVIDFAEQIEASVASAGTIAVTMKNAAALVAARQAERYAEQYHAAKAPQDEPRRDPMFARSNTARDIATEILALEPTLHADYQIVPTSAIRWLMGEGPDEKGREFGESAPVDCKLRVYWWRSHFARLIDHKWNGSAGEPAPLVLPRTLTPEIEDALGVMIFQTGPIAHALRAGGHDIKPKAEAEQAAVLFWFLHLALEHGDKWREAVGRRLTEIAEAAVPK